MDQEQKSITQDVRGAGTPKNQEEQTKSNTQMINRCGRQIQLQRTQQVQIQDKGAIQSMKMRFKGPRYGEDPWVETRTH